MGKIWIKPVPQKLVNYLQRLAFEYESYKDNLCYLISSRRNDQTLFESDNYKKYQELAVKRFAEYEMAKGAITKELLPVELQRKELKWMIDYQRAEMQLALDSCTDQDIAEQFGFVAVED